MPPDIFCEEKRRRLLAQPHREPEVDNMACTETENTTVTE